MKIIEFIDGLFGAETLGKVEEFRIREAERRLGLNFSDDYRTYLENFGYLNYLDKELTGMVKGESFNVVDVTMKERGRNNLDPDHYVIARGKSGLILQDEEGTVYKKRGQSQPEKIYKDLLGYLKSFIYGPAR